MKPGCRVLLLRPIGSATKSAERLASLGYETELLPISEIISLDGEYPEDQYDAILLTSSVAANVLLENRHRESFENLPLYCVGDRTAKSAIQSGIGEVTGVEKDANSLAELIVRKSGHRKFLYPCARHRSFDFQAAFKGYDKTCTIWEIYKNRLITPQPQSFTQSIAGCDVVFLYSKRIAGHFFQLIDRQNLSGHLNPDTRFIAISEAVRESVPRKFQPNTYIGRDKTEQGMIDRLKLL